MGSDNKPITTQTAHYLTDSRLKEFFFSKTELVPSHIEKQFNQVERIYSAIPEHPLQKYLMFSLEERFIEKPLNEQQRKLSSDHEWYELKSLDIFLSLLEKLEKQFYLHLELEKI